MLELWPYVRTFRDGEDKLDAATLNDPITQLVARTDYLKAAIVAAGGRANVAIADAPLAGSGPDGDLPALGQPVYRVPGGNAYAIAGAVVGDEDGSKWFWADHQAMAVGVVGSVPSGTSATVVLGGYISFGSGIPVGDVIVDESPGSGRYFLSATPGMLTAAPSGPIIYVCDCEIRDGNVISMLVNPQYRDTGESHIHRSFVLSGMPSGYAVRYGGYYRVSDLVPSEYAKDPVSMPVDTVFLRPLGHWAYDGEVTYTLTFARKNATGTAPADFKIDWTSGGVDSSGSIDVVYGDAGAQLVGTRGLKVSLAKRGSPDLASLVGQTWTLSMPGDGQKWLNLLGTDGGMVGFRLNLGMYPAMARFVPPLPANGAELTVGGVELRGGEFGSRRQWEVAAADDSGGPWLLWYGGEVDADSVTSPFEWNEDISDQRPRDIVLHANRMRVGPTGFVTSLQAAPGSPLKVTSAQTGAPAAQGALQLLLDIDFRSASGGAEGHEVVKRIEGSTFVTGPVVERIVAGPGMAVDRQQGTVTVSASNAVYSGDFETIALRNAKQDLAGGVFPYTKLLKWGSGSVRNVESGFSAKFRVPDHIPYRSYYVVVSASVFGEAASASAASAAFRLTGYAIADQACSADSPATGFDEPVSVPAGGHAEIVEIPFAAGYKAFDPVLVHGFGNGAEGVDAPGTLVLADTPQRVSRTALWLMSSATGRMTLKPGYFVGISVERCGFDGDAVPYEAALGFLSLRWNLVAAD